MKKETIEWIKIAIEEFDAAQHLYEIHLYRMVCYHCQQYVEKIMKAFLVEKDIEFHRTHNILDLKNILSEIGIEIPLKNEESIFLNSIYRSRYPAGLGLLPYGDPNEEDAKKAIDCAKKIKEWTEVNLNLKQ